jgi:hypothetical protein
MDKIISSSVVYAVRGSFLPPAQAAHRLMAASSNCLFISADYRLFFFDLTKSSAPACSTPFELVHTD